ncbi:membrane protein UL45 [Ateline alphaherpesvirus 1]|uniref:Membrane protein UL45 n=1 Tax=Herpesvirus ateles type 1 (strain Lennette) TaxID=35243 RepID=A0A1S6JLM3_HSVA1|nr:membrane protein UL45 [Ateline alphaherpesvirus 1]AQS79171.1 membrane protein UL45 [Ateline alphaherpesvirus 1]
MANNPLTALPVLEGGPGPRGRRRCGATVPAALIGGAVLGAVALLAAVVLSAPASAWTLGACDPGWVEFNAACLCGQARLAAASAAQSPCGPTASRPPHEVTRQMEQLSGLVNGTLRVPPASGICYRPRVPGHFSRLVISARRALGLD